MGATKDMALHPVCFGKGRQSQNESDIQIGKDMIIHPDFMTSSQPVSFCAPKVWYLVEMLLNKRVAWCPLDLTRQAVVAASPSLKQAGVPDPSTIWMHHSGKIWTQETEDAFFHTLSGQLTGSVVSSGFIIGSLLERNKKALSLFWHGWSVQKAMFFLWMQGALSTTTFSESVKLCATVYTCTVFILACGRESLPMYHLPGKFAVSLLCKFGFWELLVDAGWYQLLPGSLSGRKFQDLGSVKLHQWRYLGCFDCC